MQTIRLRSGGKLPSLWFSTGQSKKSGFASVADSFTHSLGWRYTCRLCCGGYYSELQNIDCRSLWIQRNTIFARYGRVFQSAEVRAYFNQQSWYRPNPGYHEGLLSQAEKQSAARILAAEKSSDCL
jgi:hypothetical protein